MGLTLVHYIYDANNLSATPTKLTAFDGAADNYFGTKVFVTADKIIVSANLEDRSGAVYIYDANNLSATPTKLTAYDGAANDYFGRSVFATADKIVVGASYDDDNGENSGSVYVYDANNLSATPTKLTAFDGAANDQFGIPIAATSDKIFVGARNDDSYTGAVYVYDANNLSAQPTKLTAFDGAANNYFGSTITVTANKIFVAAYLDDRSGSVYVYDANNLSATPTKLTAFDGARDDYFGSTITVTANKIFVTALLDDRSGSVYVYDANNLSATPTKLTAYDGAASDYFGQSVSVTADKIFVGAPRDDDNGNDSGSVYVYDANNLSATPTKLTAFDGAADDRFGHTVVTISGTLSQLNGTTVSQSDNTFTVTPGQQDADFQLTFKATDTAGNVTSVPAEFSYDYVNQAPVGIWNPVGICTDSRSGRCHYSSRN